MDNTFYNSRCNYIWRLSVRGKKKKEQMKYIGSDTNIQAIKLVPEGGDDHIIYIVGLGYPDVELYNVLMVDAYRTPTSEIHTAEYIYETYGVVVSQITKT